MSISINFGTSDQVDRNIVDSGWYRHIGDVIRMNEKNLLKIFVMAVTNIFLRKQESARGALNG